MKKKKKSKKKDPKKEEWIKSIFVSTGIAIFLNNFIFRTIYVLGNSMNPSLKNGDRLLLKKYKAVFNIEEYRHGDIIVFDSPLKKDQKRFFKKAFIKRVIGLPGDEIKILDGEVFVNDQSIDESYIEKDVFTQAIYYGENHIIPEGEVFVIGDNRKPGASNDSRSFGTIPLESIKGKIVYRVYPFNKLGGDLK